MRFLRRFRKEVISEGKFKKFLAYVIGELFLIVLGIIIAVQINNWNTLRKFRQTEKVYLTKLVADLENDLLRFQFLTAMYKEDLQKCDSLLAILDRPLSKEDKLSMIGMGFLNFYSLNPSTATYDEMVNTGKLYGTTNQQLRKKIVVYYNDLSRQNSYFDNSNNRVKLYMDRDNMSDYWLLKRRIFNSLNISNQDFPWLTKATSEELRAIETTTYMYQSATKKNLNRLNILQKSIATLQRAIQEEIDKG